MLPHDHITLSLLPPADGEGSLLERLLALGLDVPFGCRNGNCWCCRARLLAGDASGPPDPAAPLAADELLLCRARARTAVSLQLRCGGAPQALPCQQCGYRSTSDGATLQLRWAAGRRRLPRAGQTVTVVTSGATLSARVAALDITARRLTLTLDGTPYRHDVDTATVYFAARDPRP